MEKSIEKLIPRTVNPDLQKERNAATFKVEEFAEWVHGGAEKLRFKRQFEKYIFEALPDENGTLHFKSYIEVYEHTIKKLSQFIQQLRKLQAELNPAGDDIWPHMYYSFNSWALLPLSNPFEVQMVMMLPALQMHCTDEQWERFGRRVKYFEVAAAYAQTELGHGTNLRALETRADFDRKTDEFILNTPSLTSYKWWPGGLGHSANYCLVVAQLYINDVHKGIQIFIVPVRDDETHQTLPGVEVGDIGSKLGLNAVNNGYLALRNVRIPRTNMLMRHVKVLRDGTFIPSTIPQINYFGMLSVRCFVVARNAAILCLAATIATRYSAVRRQGSINDKTAECQILDYVTQQQKLLSEIATAVAYFSTMEYMWSVYDQTAAEMKRGDFSRLPEMHIMSCVLKALSSYDGSHGVERLRQACGGHGFMSSSNMSVLYASSTASVTYEGENTVLLLQTGRALLKAWQAALQGKSLAATMDYLAEAVRNREFAEWSGKRDNIVKALQHAAANKLRLAYENIERRIEAGRTPAEAFNETGLQVIEAAELHGRAFVCATFLANICGGQAKRSAHLNLVLERLLDLYIVQTALRCTSDLLRFIRLSEADLCALQSRLEELLQELRPDAVAICDGFDMHDRVLNSTLGSYDGNVYERLYADTKRNPMNEISVPSVYEKYLKPVLKSNL